MLCPSLPTRSSRRPTGASEPGRLPRVPGLGGKQERGVTLGCSVWPPQSCQWVEAARPLPGPFRRAERCRALSSGAVLLAASALPGEPGIPCAVAPVGAPRCGLGSGGGQPQGWGRRDWALALGALPAAPSGVLGLGRHGPPARLHPLPHALLAAAAGALAARPVRSLCVRRTETKQNKLVSWPEQRADPARGGVQRAPGLSPPPRGSGCRQPHPVGCFFLFGILRNR